MIVQEYLKLIKKWSNEYGPNTIVLMQVGSFFEIYALKDENGKKIGSNIEEISSHCDLLIANKNQKVDNKSVLMAGFGLTQYDKYVKKILEINYTCIVYRQDIQAPNSSRSLSEIISPGTHFNNDKDLISNNIACVWIQKIDKTKYNPEHVKMGISSIDISTGDGNIAQYESLYYNDPSTYDDIERHISIIAPHETILVIRNFEQNEHINLINYLGLSNKKYHIIDNENTDLYKTSKNAETQKYQTEIMTTFFPNISLETIFDAFRSHELSMQAYTLLLNFVNNHNPNIIQKISFAKLEHRALHLHLANHSLRQLNIITDEGINGKCKSVCNLLNNCQTKMGKRKFYYNLTRPTIDEATLSRQYDDIESAIETDVWREIREKLKGIKDIDFLCRKLINKKITPRDIAKLYDDLLLINDINQILKKHDNLNKSIELINLDCEEDIIGINNLLKENFDIEKCYELDNLSGEKLGLLSPDQACFILPDSNKEIKSLLDNCENYNKFLLIIQAYFSQVIAGYEKKKSGNLIKIHETPKSSPVLLGTNRRMQILLSGIKKTNLKEINLEGYTLNLEELEVINSGSNKKDQIITSPQIKEICNGLQESRETLIEELNKVFYNFCESLQERIKEINKIADFTAWCDCIQNACFIAITYDYSKPSIIESDKSFFKVEELRHPLIEQIQLNETYISNDLSLGNQEEYDGLLLYGTNAVGKSSFIKSIGIVIIMAQAGLWVPCKKLEFKPYKKIFTRILGNDNIFKGLSTFAVEMSELRTILNNSDEYSLVIGDEVCSGTESNSAKSIFTAAIEWLHKQQSSFIFATHFHEINKYDEINNLKRLNKMHMAVIYDRNLGCLVYDRKLKQGPGADMYGLEVCKSLNLPDTFLKRAHNLRIIHGNHKDILNLDSSTYNSNKLKGNCELCGEKGDDVHHMAYQVNANERNYVNGHNKNHPANLMILCENCHKNIHKENIEYRKVLTSDGYKFLEISN